MRPIFGLGSIGAPLGALRSGLVTHPQMRGPAELGGQLRYEIEQLPDDPEEQVELTIRKMADFTREDIDAAIIQQRAQSLGAGQIPEREYVNRVFNHVRRVMQFADDAVVSAPVGIDPAKHFVMETIIRPVDVELIVRGGQIAQGDCDDHSMYAAALLEAGGVPARFVTVAADPVYPQLFSHVYTAAYPRKGDGSGERERIAVDASHGDYAGWETKNLGRLREWGVRRPDVPHKEAMVIGLLILAKVALGWKGSGRSTKH